MKLATLTPEKSVEYTDVIYGEAEIEGAERYTAEHYHEQGEGVDYHYFRREGMWYLIVWDVTGGIFDDVRVYWDGDTEQEVLDLIADLKKMG